MAGFVNHHSFLLLGGVFLAIWAGVLLMRRGRRGWIFWGLALLLLGAGWLVLRTTVPEPPKTVADIEASIASGQPVLVEIYSNY
jgi:hypothetical protein